MSNGYLIPKSDKGQSSWDSQRDHHVAKDVIDRHAVGVHPRKEPRRLEHIDSIHTPHTVSAAHQGLICI